ncbi:MAG: adenine phosphoribosyltransferase [Gemmatimonadota bacterium]
MKTELESSGDAALVERLRATLRDVPDFPKPGILFKDITPVLGNGELLSDVARAMAAPWRASGVTHVAGIESRGFILGAPVAIELGVGFVPIRKPGKLPWRVTEVEYALEYGTDRLAMHDDACAAPARVLVVDDVLATGGTAAAACQLVERGGGTVVGCSFLLDIAFLEGMNRLGARRCTSLYSV